MFELTEIAERTPRHAPAAGTGTCAWSANDADIEAAYRVLDALPVPALLLDRTRAIRHSNVAAGPHLAEPLCLCIAGGRVCRFAGPASEAFDVVFARALEGQSSAVAVTVSSNARRSLWRVSLAPFDRTGSGTSADEPSVLLVLEPPLASYRALPLLERLFGLTVAEARVLALLLDDRRPKEIARELDIAVATVRSHLKSLFVKTGTRCQTELLGLALSAA